MELRITARHMELFETVKDYAEKRIIPIERYFDKIIDAHLVLSKEKHSFYQAELSVKISGTTLLAKSTTEEINSSIDDVTHKMERQLKEHKSKIRSRKGTKYNSKTIGEIQDII